jgi:hypothetical protein
MELKIKEWIDSIEQAGCSVEAVSILHEIRKPDGKLLFALVNARVRSPEGSLLPHIIFVRGHA